MCLHSIIYNYYAQTVLKWGVHMRMRGLLYIDIRTFHQDDGWSPFLFGLALYS